MEAREADQAAASAADTNDNGGFMTIRDQVVVLLENNKLQALSGEEMAEQLNCTRAAVGKAINELRELGYEIEAANRKGYTLTKSADALVLPVLQKKLNEELTSIRVICLDTVDSTNSYLKRMVADGETGDMVVVATEQTAGRGRRGRSFFSPEGSGLYMSFLLHPQCKAEEATMLTTVAAVAEAMAIEEVTGEKAEIKWVNDLVLRHKKISGILTEAATSMEDGGLDYCIVGIGINLYDPKGGWPDEIKEIAGSIAGKDKESGAIENLKNNMAGALINKFMEFYSAFPQVSYLKEYEKRCFCIGKDVTVMSPDHEEIRSDSDGHDRSKAKVLGVNERCHLHLRYSDGYEEYLSSGEISIKL